MSHPKFKLYRQRITDEDREKHPWMRGNQTHLISIEVLISGDKYTSEVVKIFPDQLKLRTDCLFKEVISAYYATTSMITEIELKELGFKEVQPRCIEEDFYFDWMELKKNDSNLSVTTEFTLKGKFITQYVDFNGETLKGEKMTIEDLKLLIKLM